MLSAVLHGMLLAFGLILPLGVQNVFVFNQGATQPKFRSTLPVVITASICDTLLISLAILGISVIVLGVGWIKYLLLTAGILFLLFMGYVTWKNRPPTDTGEGHALSPKKQIVFALSVSLLNPHAIMDTIGVIGTSSITYSGFEKMGFALACIIVSWIWFLSLAFIGRQVGRLNQSGKFIILLNKVSALIMWATAIFLLHTLLTGA